jgi:hypothetical protein
MRIEPANYCGRRRTTIARFPIRQGAALSPPPAGDGCTRRTTTGLVPAPAGGRRRCVTDLGRACRAEKKNETWGQTVLQMRLRLAATKPICSVLPPGGSTNVNDSKANLQEAPSSASLPSPVQQHQDDLRRKQRQAQEALVKRRWSQAQAQQLQLSRKCGGSFRLNAAMVAAARSLSTGSWR